MGRFPGQLLRQTELIKRSLRLDDAPKWWCQEPLHKCKDFDGLWSADLAFWDGASLESPGRGGGMASNQVSSDIKRGTDGEAAAPNRKTHKKLKVEKNVA